MDARRIEAHDYLAGKGRDGEFRPWVGERCGFSKSSAYNYIQASQVFGVCPTVGQTFDATALYALSSDTCPEAATDEAIKRPIGHSETSVQRLHT